MENNLKYFYNIEVNNLRKYGLKYLFEYNGGTFIFEEIYIDEKEVNFANDLSIKLLYNNIPMHVLLLNKFSKFITEINGVKFVLMKVIAAKKSIHLEDVFKFSQLVGNGKCHWKELWIDKLDYFEQNLIEFGSNLKSWKEFFYYYEGMAEIGISLLKNKNFDLCVSHKRINNNLFEFYNPLNITIDIKSRDLSEYIKFVIYNGFNLEQIYDYIDDILLTLTNDEKINFFARLFFNCYYFDNFEKEISKKNNSNQLYKIKKHTKEYEQILLYVYNKIGFYVKIPNIDFLLQ